MGEIIIKVDLEGNGETIQSSLGGLKEYRDILVEIKSHKDALATAETITNVKKLTAELKRAELQVAALQRKEQERSEKAAKKAQEEQSAYKQLSAQYREALQRAKDLAAQEVLTGQERSKATTMAISEARVFNDQLKAIDASMGNYQRNVGNYHGQLSSLSKTLKGFSGLGRILGNAIGVDMAWVDTIKEAGKALHYLRNIQQAGNVANTEGAVATELATEATVKQAAASSASIPIIGAVIAAIGLAAAAVIYYKDQIFGLSEAQKDKMRADDGNIISDEKMRESYNKNIKVLRDLNVEYGILTGRITEYEGEILNIKNKNKDALDEISKDTKTKLEETGGWWGALKLSIAQNVGLGSLELEKQLDEVGGIIDSANDAKKKQEEVQTAEERNALAKKYKEIDDDIAAAIARINAKQLADKKKADAEYEKLSDEAHERILKKNKEFYAQEQQDLFEKWMDEIKLQEKAHKAQENMMMNSLKEREDMEKQYAKAHKDDLDKIIEEAKKGDVEAMEYLQTLSTLEITDSKKAAKALDDIHKEKFDKIKEQGNQVLTFLQSQADAKRRLAEMEVKWAQDAIDVQVKLAIAGKSNNLAEAEANKAKLQKEAFDQARKVEKLKKLEAYYNLFANYARDAKPGEAGQAARKAFTDVILGEVLARAFAAEGGMMGDLMKPIAGGSLDKGLFKGRSHAAGGITTVLETQGGEGILTDDEVQNLGGPRAFYLLKDLLANPIKDDDFVEHQAQSFTKVVPIYSDRQDSGEVVDAVNRMTEELQSIPRISQGIDGLGNIMTYESTKGLIRKTTQKPRQI